MPDRNKPAKEERNFQYNLFNYRINIKLYKVIGMLHFGVSEWCLCLEMNALLLLGPYPLSVGLSTYLVDQSNATLVPDFQLMKLFSNTTPISK